MADTPHFDLPFQVVADGSFGVVDQDSYRDIANCVEVIVRTPLGFRIDLLDFGMPDLLFGVQPLVKSDIIEFVAAQEPRAEVLFSERPDVLDALIDHITVEVR